MWERSEYRGKATIAWVMSSNEIKGGMGWERKISHGKFKQKSSNLMNIGGHFNADPAPLLSAQAVLKK